MDGQLAGNREAAADALTENDMRRRRIRVLILSVLLSFLLLFALQNFFDGGDSDSSADPSEENSGSFQPDSSKLVR
jgi:hypothetical protein